MKVRVLETRKYRGRWYIPGTPQEIIDAPPEMVEEWGSTVEMLEPAVPPEAMIPDDFPYGHVLKGLGIDTLDKLMEIDDFTALKGIGPKSAEAIEQAIGKL